MFLLTFYFASSLKIYQVSRFFFLCFFLLIGIDDIDEWFETFMNVESMDKER